MREKFEVVGGILHRLWPTLKEKIDLGKYGDNLSWRDEAGEEKYSGILFRCRSKDGFLLASQTTGTLPDREEAETTADLKTALVFSRSECVASMELRNPEVGHWGGGIKTSTDRRKACAITGLPEILDHLLLAHALRIPRLLTHSDFLKVTDLRLLKGLPSAIERVGMSDVQFLGLGRLIEMLVAEAAYPS